MTRMMRRPWFIKIKKKKNMDNVAAIIQLVDPRDGRRAGGQAGR